MLFQCMQRGVDDTPELKDDYDFEDREIFNRPDYPKLFFVENRYAGDPTNWFIPNKAATEAMLRSAGFTMLQNPEPEVYLLRCSTRRFMVEKPPLIRLQDEGQG